jgi:hypothetical protein
MTYNKPFRSLSDLYSSIYLKEGLENEKNLLDKETFSKVSEKLTRARRGLKHFDLDLGLYLDTMRTVLTRSPKCKTMAVDKLGNIYINVDFLLNELTLKETIGVLAHEVSHIYNLTFPRQKGRIHELWNIATDYSMNRDIIAAKLELPEFGLIPKEINGRLFIKNKLSIRTLGKEYNFDIDITDYESPEEIYNLLVKQIKEQDEEAEKNKPEENEPPEEGDENGEDEGEEINIGDIVKDEESGTYGEIKSIDPSTGEAIIEPLTKEEAKKRMYARS